MSSETPWTRALCKVFFLLLLPPLSIFRSCNMSSTYAHPLRWQLTLGCALVFVSAGYPYLMSASRHCKFSLFFFLWDLYFYCLNFSTKPLASTERLLLPGGDIWSTEASVPVKGFCRSLIWGNLLESVWLFLHSPFAPRAKRNLVDTCLCW